MIVKVTGRYFIPTLVDEINRVGKKASLIVQGTENFWSMYEDDGGVIRSEVVGWKKGMEGWLYEGQNEAIGVPMERVLALKARDLEARGRGRNERKNVAKFGRMDLEGEGKRNAEGVVIKFL